MSPRARRAASTGLDQSSGFVAFEQVEKQPQTAALLVGEALVPLERGFRFRPRPRQKAAVDLESGETKAGRAGLPRAEHIALAAQPQILLGDAEAVLGLAQDLDPRPRRFAERSLVEQKAGRAPAPRPTRPRN